MLEGGYPPSARRQWKGFSIPNDVEPGDDHEVVAVPGDMLTMNEGCRNAGSSKSGLFHYVEGHCTASFINQTNEQSNQVKDAYVVA